MVKLAHGDRFDRVVRGIKPANEQLSERQVLREQPSDVGRRFTYFDMSPGLTPNIEQDGGEAVHVYLQFSRLIRD